MRSDAPARFRYNEEVKVAWIRKFDEKAPSPVQRLRPYYFDLDAKGNPVPTSLWGWAYFCEFQRERRIIARTEIGEIAVSTVFLGMDRSWFQGPPVTFESMIFGGPFDNEQQRYVTKAEALAGHADLVARCQGPEGVGINPRLSETEGVLT